MSASRLAISLLAMPCLLTPALSQQPPGISIHLDTYAARRKANVPPRLYSLPPEKWCGRYESESIVYVPGETAHVTVEVSPGQASADGEIAVVSFVSGETRRFYRGALTGGTYGPYETAIGSDFEIYQVQVRLGDATASKGFYGIRPWRGMKSFSDEVSFRGISLAYEKTTPWDLALKEGTPPFRALDPNWASESYRENAALDWDDWWLWTHYACGMVGIESGRTGLFWGEYNPWLYSKLGPPERPLKPSEAVARRSLSERGGLATEIILPNGIYFRERMQPLLRKWATNVSEGHPGEPMTVVLGTDWDIEQGIGRRFGPETLRHFVSWMKEQFGIAIEADTFERLIAKCREYPRHFQYFVARNTTFRSLELTCEAVREVVGGSGAWSRSGPCPRELIALPEAAEFCQIASRCIAVGAGDDERARRLAGGNPVPHSLCRMVVKGLAPDQNFCVGGKGCVEPLTEGEIYRWYLEPAWLTAYDRKGEIHQLYTHSPPTGSEGVWRSLVEEANAPDEKIRVHDKCFQLMEAIGVERPLGPVFVCKDWTFGDDVSGTAFRSDLYETFLISLRRHKVPVSCAVHAENESALPEGMPRIYAPRMNGSGEIRFGFRAGAVQKWFVGEKSRIPDSVIASFAAELASASGEAVVFPAGTSIEGYAFEARGMKFVVAEEMSGRKARGNVRVRVGQGEWDVIDVIAAKRPPSRRRGEDIVFEASLEPNSATLYCLVPRRRR